MIIYKTIHGCETTLIEGTRVTRQFKLTTVFFFLGIPVYKTVEIQQNPL